MSSLAIMAAVLPVGAIVHLGWTSCQIWQNIHALNRCARICDLQKTSCQIESQVPQFVVLVPLLHEAHIAELCVSRFIQELALIQNLTLAFITHQIDIQTTCAVEDAMRSKGVEASCVHVVGDAGTTKAEQITFALRKLPIDLTECIVSIYDADSIPDRRQVAWLRQNFEALLKAFPHGFVVQQPPFYPHVLGRSLGSRLALARNVHSLNYHYTAELTTFRRSLRSNFFRMAIHLLGHGEHLHPLVLRAANGFKPPYGDSRLGFNISYRDLPIIPSPFPDLSSSPEKLFDTYRQGLKWYSACTLYTEELKKVGWSPKRAIMTLYTFLNNIRWGAFPCLVILSAICLAFLSPGTSFQLSMAILAATFLRHMALFIAYRQLKELSPIRVQISTPSYAEWCFQLFPAYCGIRIIWALVPLHHLLLRASGSNVEPYTTPKSSI